MISFGTLTYIKPAIRRMREAGFKSKALQIPLVDAAGKLSYPMDIKEKIFRSVYNYFKDWHNDVFFYFCMEDKSLWNSVFGYYYETNDQFEKALFKYVKSKMTNKI
jgi:spore photoproduct lyase